MINYDKYKGYSLMSVMFDVNENDSIAIFAKTGEDLNVLAYGRVGTLIEVLASYILGKAIIECKFDKYASKWYVKIDIDKEGKNFSVRRRLI